MTLQEEMHTLAQELIASYDARAVAIDSLRKRAVDQRRAARSHVDELRRTRQVMAQQLRGELMRAEEQRRARLHSWMGQIAVARRAMAGHLREGLARERGNLKNNVTSLSRDLGQARQAIGLQLHANLAETHAGLVHAEERRKAEVAAWMKDVAAERVAADEAWQNLTSDMRARRIRTPRC